jgi:hypothetical protein
VFARPHPEGSDSVEFIELWEDPALANFAIASIDERVPNHVELARETANLSSDHVLVEQYEPLQFISRKPPVFGGWTPGEWEGIG